MTLHYLTHLAELGIANLHPLGRRATAGLLAAMAPRPGQDILEIGCGTATTLVQLAQNSALNLVGLEFLPQMLKMGQSRLTFTGLHQRIRLVQGSGTAIPFPAGSFHHIYTESVLGFQDESTAQTMLTEIYRVLRPGGQYLANEAIWKPNISAQQARDIYDQCVADFGLCQTSPQPWSLDEWTDVMVQAGFQLVSAHFLNQHLSQEPAKHPTRSTLFTQANRLKGYLHPRLIRERLNYRRRLHAHRDDGQYMESRLFILQKP